MDAHHLFPRGPIELNTPRGLFGPNYWGHSQNISPKVGTQRHLIRCAIEVL